MSFLHYPYPAEEYKPHIHPHMANAIHHNEGMKKALLRQILAKNLERAMESSVGADTQITLAKRAGIGQSHVSRILRGESAATVDVLAALGEALNIQPWELLSDEDSTRQAIMERVLGWGSKPEAVSPSKVSVMRRRRKQG